MSKAKRYRLALAERNESSRSGMVVDAQNGDYVLHTDYAALEAELAKAREMIERLSTPVSTQEAMKYVKKRNDYCLSWEEAISKLIAARSKDPQ